MNRIYGNEQPQPDWQSRSHLIDAELFGLGLRHAGRVRVPARLQEFRRKFLQHLWGELRRRRPGHERLQVRVPGRGRDSVRSGQQPSHTARYYHGQFGGGLDGFELDADYEVLGSDGGRKGFATPLATLHLWDGWVNEFLTTPANGLRDFYVSGGSRCPARRRSRSSTTRSSRISAT